MRRSIALVVFVAVAQVACATRPYVPSSNPEGEFTLRLRQGEPQVERGEPNAWVDGFGHYLFSLPSKLVLLDWRVDNHDISIDTEQALQAYLAANGLCNVKVRLNQYAPGGEWRRLFKNRDMPLGWRYTLGILSTAFYTIFPERLFAGFPFIGGGDHYNPYTNTISIYSDRRPIVLHEGGHSKDFAERDGRQWKGVYAGARSIPYVGLLVAIWQEAVATGDALDWDIERGDPADLRRAYRSLYPAYGTYLGGTAQEVASLFTGGWLLYAIQYGVVVAGHAVGQTRALFVPDDPESGLAMELTEAPPEWPSDHVCVPGGPLLPDADASPDVPEGAP